MASASMASASIAPRVQAMAMMMSTRCTLDPLGVGERDERDVAAAEEDEVAGHDLDVTLGRQLAEHAVAERHDGMRDGMRDGGLQSAPGQRAWL